MRFACRLVRFPLGGTGRGSCFRGRPAAIAGLRAPAAGPSLPLRRFDPDRPVLVDTREIGDAARVVPSALVAKTGLQRRGNVPRIDADHWPAIALQHAKQLGCSTTGSKPIRSIASPAAAIQRAMVSGSVGSLVSRTILPLLFSIQSARSPSSKHQCQWNTWWIFRSMRRCTVASKDPSSLAKPERRAGITHPQSKTAAPPSSWPSFGASRRNAADVFAIRPYSAPRAAGRLRR